LWVLLLILGGCAATTEPWRLPDGARPALSQRWLAGDGRYAWPPDDGYAAPPVLVVLPAGVLLDRFGGPGGSFLSPHGAGFDARALPSQCQDMLRQYHVYEVVRPLPVWAGKAAPWFDEPGGATQFKTDAPVTTLLDDHTLVEPTPPPAPPRCPN
jgi:hypothetical protein